MWTTVFDVPKRLSSTIVSAQVLSHLIFLNVHVFSLLKYSTKPSDWNDESAYFSAGKGFNTGEICIANTISNLISVHERTWRSVGALLRVPSSLMWSLSWHMTGSTLIPLNTRTDSGSQRWERRNVAPPRAENNCQLERREWSMASTPGGGRPQEHQPSLPVLLQRLFHSYQNVSVSNWTQREVWRGGGGGGSSWN